MGGASAGSDAKRTRGTRAEDLLVGRFALEPFHSPVAEQDGHLSVVIRWDIGIRVDSENGISLRPIRRRSPPDPCEVEPVAISKGKLISLRPLRWPPPVGSLDLSEVLIREVEAADVIVIGTPMHDLTIRSALKAWIDQILRVGRTMKSTPASRRMERGGSAGTLMRMRQVNGSMGRTLTARISISPWPTGKASNGWGIDIVTVGVVESNLAGVVV